MSAELTFEFEFSDLNIKTSDFIRLLGYQENNLPLQLNSALNEILSEAGSHAEIRGGYVIKDIWQLDINKGIVKLDNTNLSPGTIICENLYGSEKLICFLCTAGEGITKWASIISETDPLKFYMIDMMGSLIVQYAVENFHSDMEKTYINHEMKVTNSYSPGYCGWKLAEQKKLFSLFPDNFCNIRLNNSFLMTPLKSVSGIIGAGKRAERRAYSCQICDLPGCIYRDLNR